MTTTIRQRMNAFASLHGTSIAAIRGGFMRTVANARLRLDAWRSERVRHSALPIVRRTGELLTIAPPRRAASQASPIGSSTVIVRCATVTRFSLLHPFADGATWNVVASISGDHSNEETLLAEGLRFSEAQWVLRRIGALMEGASASAAVGDGSGGSWFWRVAAAGVIAIAVVWAWPSNKGERAATPEAMMDPTFMPETPQFSALPMPGSVAPIGSSVVAGEPLGTDAFGLSGGDSDAGVVGNGLGGQEVAPMAGCDPGMAFEVK